MLVGACAIVAATGAAQAADKFKVTSVSCEMYWYSQHMPVLAYDIVDERRTDYNTNPPADYFRQAAQRTQEYCDRTSNKPSSVFGLPRQIKGVWFQSNDGSFKVLYRLDTDVIDSSAGIVNRIGEQYAAAEHHRMQLEEVRTRDARASELKAAEAKAAQDRLETENARVRSFFNRKDLQLSRLGSEVTPANFTGVDAIRTNPYHFRKLGLAVVHVQFNRMLNEKLALFGNELKPLLVHIDDVDRFTKSGETVMLAVRVIERGEVERSYGSLPEIVLSAIKAEPIFGEYVGAYTCPAEDCQHVFDAAPPT